jgi:RNA polymerase sigma-70 factor (ECF subfamily)
MPVTELVIGVIEGRLDFSELQQRFERGIYRMMIHLTRNAADAGELTQQLFVKVFKLLPSFDPKRASFTSWIYRIGYNLAMDFFRERRDAPLSLDIMTEQEGPAEDGPDVAHEASERRKRVLEAFAKLRPLDRNLLVGFHVEKLPWEVVAARNHVTVRHARYRAGVAMRKLRESM